MDLAAVLKAIETWPVEDRMELARYIWDQLVDSGWHPELTDEVKAELDRRLAALDANPNDVVTWDSIVEHVRRKG